MTENYVRLHTGTLTPIASADVHENLWVRGCRTATLTISTLWSAPVGGTMLAVNPPVVTYPQWGGGVYAQAQLRDRMYREAVARWVKWA